MRKRMRCILELSVTANKAELTFIREGSEKRNIAIVSLGDDAVLLKNLEQVFRNFEAKAPGA